MRVRIPFPGKVASSTLTPLAHVERGHPERDTQRKGDVPLDRTAISDRDTDGYEETRREAAQIGRRSHRSNPTNTASQAKLAKT